MQQFLGKTPYKNYMNPMFTCTDNFYFYYFHTTYFATVAVYFINMNKY